MTTLNCTDCQKLLPDLLLEPELVSPVAREHLSQCLECRTELVGLRSTMDLLDLWAAPEPSPYFDSRVHALLREAESESPEGLWERLLDTLRFSTGRELRPAVAGLLALILLLGGGHGRDPVGWSPKRAGGFLARGERSADIRQQRPGLATDGSTG